MKDISKINVSVGEVALVAVIEIERAIRADGSRAGFRIVVLRGVAVRVECSSIAEVDQTISIWLAYQRQ